MFCKHSSITGIAGAILNLDYHKIEQWLTFHKLGLAQLLSSSSARTRSSLHRAWQ